MKKYFITIIIALSSASTILLAQTTQTVKTYYDPLSKTKIYEVYSVITGTPTKHGTYKAYDENGIIDLEGTYKNGIQNGIFKFYDCGAGVLSKLVTYKDGIEDGLAEIYNCKIDNNDKQISWKRSEFIYKNGKVVKETRYYENGKLSAVIQADGLCSKYYDNGQKGEEFTNKIGNKDGSFTSWFENGNIQEKGMYLNDNKVGTWIEYFSNGKVKRESHIGSKKDLNTGKEYFENGNLKFEKDSIGDNLYKEVWYDSISTKIISESHFKYYQPAGYSYKTYIQDGVKLTYYANGQIKDSTNFKDGKRDGYFKEWYYNGQLKTTCIYSNNNFSGKYISYYSNGNKESELTYENKGITSWKTGKEINYYENGKIKSQGNYLRDVKDSTWTIYKETGDIDYYEMDGNAGRIKYTQKEYEEKNATKQYYTNKTNIEKKLADVISLYGCTTQRKESSLTKYSNQIEYTDMGITKIYMPSKKTNLFNGFAILYNNLTGKISEYSPMIDNVTYQKQLIALLDKMSTLINSDTKDIEKQLKKEVDSDKIKTIFGL